jgi:hypothetical protein
MFDKDEKDGYEFIGSDEKMIGNVKDLLMLQKNY